MKGVLTPDIDDGVFRHSLFRGKESSYSRLAVYPIEKILEIFRHELPRPPEKYLVGFLVINVGALKKLGREYRTKEIKNGVDLKVIPVPLPAMGKHVQNDAHAETRPNISDGLAREIAQKLTGNFTRVSGEEKADEHGTAAQPPAGS